MIVLVICTMAMSLVTVLEVINSIRKGAWNIVFKEQIAKKQIDDFKKLRAEEYDSPQKPKKSGKSEKSSKLDPQDTVHTVHTDMDLMPEKEKYNDQ